MIALKVREFYPDRVAVIPIHDEDNDSYSCALYKVHKDGRHYTDILYELGHYNNTDETGAIKEMVRTVEDAMKTVRVMSN